MEDASLPNENDSSEQGSRTPHRQQRLQQMLQKQQSDAASTTVTAAGAATADGSGASRHESRREKKLGHRRVDDEGTVTYKKKSSKEIMDAIQLGIYFSTSQIEAKEKRDVLLTDFGVINTIAFPKDGGPITPKHAGTDFRFRVYAPYAFRHFRQLFGVDTRDFMTSLCNNELLELSNPGASGSIFYITKDDEFIIKTVQHKEASFLRKLLPEYYMNLNQNPRTLLPKFYGLFCYQCGNKNIRFIVMNNLLPSSINMHERYDLKGSTFKRAANARERAKQSPTLKDLDFREAHPDGLFLEAYDALLTTIIRDCRVLESFRIMDYSLLLGVHNLDVAKKERSNSSREEPDRKGAQADLPTRPTSAPPSSGIATTTDEEEDEGSSSPLPSVVAKGSAIAHRLLQRSKSARQRIAKFSTAMESIQASNEPVELEKEEAEWVPPGGIPARNAKGERLLLFVGIIDILQNYRFLKKMEHRVKSIAYDGDTISVHNPSFYKERFHAFFKNVVFHQVPSLDEPEIIGPNAQRFRRLVHLAMRSQAARRRAAANMATGDEAVVHRQRRRPSAPDQTVGSANQSFSRSDTAKKVSDGTQDTETGTHFTFQYQYSSLASRRGRTLPALGHAQTSEANADHTISTMSRIETLV